MFTARLAVITSFVVCLAACPPAPSSPLDGGVGGGVVGTGGGAATGGGVGGGSGGSGGGVALPEALDRALTVNGTSGAEREPFIAVSPSGRIAISFLATVSAGYSVGYVISNDFGQTWGPVTVWPLMAPANIMANASVAAADDDTLYMAWGAEQKTASGVRSNLAVYVARSKSGTSVFEPPVLLSDPNAAVAVIDQPRVVVTHAGVVNVAYMSTLAGSYATSLENARSTDGQTFARTTAVGAGTYGSFRNEARFCRPRGSGRLFMVYVDSDVAAYTADLAVALRYSDDEGATWSTPLAVTTADEELTLVPSANLGCVTEGNEVWIFYGLSPEGALLGEIGGSSANEPTLTHLRLAHSGNGGLTIDRRADVLDPAAAIRAQYPVLSIEAGGALDLAYYAGSYDGDTAAELRRTRSPDGIVFAATRHVYGPLRLETSRTTATWAGDFMGSAAVAGNVLLVFTDNVSGPTHVSFYRSPAELPADAGEPVLNPRDGGAVAAGCYAGGEFTPKPWAPPTAFGQHACTPGQLSAYYACISAGDCAAFRAQSANTGCLSCLETDVGAAAHGPVLTGPSADGGRAIVGYNTGGCQAHFDGQVDAGSCGEQSNDFNDCVYFECGACSDYSSPAPSGPTYDCYYRAISVGACAQHRETTACYNETLDGGSAACGAFDQLMALWCGG